jgi:hypothetical protein
MGLSEPVPTAEAESKWLASRRILAGAVHERVPVDARSRRTGWGPRERFAAERQSSMPTARLRRRFLADGAPYCFDFRPTFGGRALHSLKGTLLGRAPGTLTRSATVTLNWRARPNKVSSVGLLRPRSSS